MVTFSPFNQVMKLQSLDPEKIAAVHYSLKDIRSHKNEIARDVSRLSRKVQEASANGKPLTEDDLMKCLGLEAFIDRNMLMRIVQMKSSHSIRVFGKQDRQRQMGIRDAKELARASMLGSEWSKVRSHGIAVNHMNAGYCA